MAEIKNKVKNKKFKFWIIGTLVALIGVFIARLGIKFFPDVNALYIKLTGYTFVIIGLFLLTFAINRKVINKD